MSQKNLIYCLLLILVAACTGGPREEEVSFDELAPASDKYKEGEKEGEKEQKTAQYFDSLSSFSQRYIDSMHLPHANIYVLDTLIFPDRFGAMKTEKWALKTATDSLVFMYWKFKDSLKTENTFFNWLDCYGNRCASIHVGDNTAFGKRGQLFIVQGQYLFSIQSGKKIDLEKNLAFFDAEKWEKQRKYIALQQVRKKTEWKKRDSEGNLLDFQDKKP